MKKDVFTWMFDDQAWPTITLIIVLCAFVYFGAGLLVAFAPQIREFTQNFDRILFGAPLAGLLK